MANFLLRFVVVALVLALLYLLLGLLPLPGNVQLILLFVAVIVAVIYLLRPYADGGRL